MAVGDPRVSVCLPARNEAATIGAIVAEAVRPRARRRGRRARRRLDRRHRRASRRRPGRGSWPRRRSSPRPGRDRARATRCGSRCTRARATSSAGSTPTCATSAASTSSGCARRCSPQPDTMFVKAYYTRSFEGAPTGGGRVTELVARPLLSLLFPKLADIVQPLGGEYAARRERARSRAVRRGLGRRARPARRRRRALRPRRGRAGRPRRPRAPQPPARRARAAGARGHGHRAAARRPAAERDGAVRRVAARRARRNVDARAGRGARAPADDHGAGVPSAVRAASIAASSTSSAARVYASLDCHTRSVSASTCTPARSASAARRIVGDLARDDRDVGDVEVVGPREHAADDLAREARRVELALAGDHEVGALERGFEADRFGDDVETGHELARRSRRARPRARPPRPRPSAASRRRRCACGTGRRASASRRVKQRHLRARSRPSAGRNTRPRRRTAVSTSHATVTSIPCSDQPSASTAASPPSVVALPPTATRTRLKPCARTAAISSPVPRVLARSGSLRPATSASPLACAISTIAMPPGSTPHSASTGSPSGPVTRVRSARSAPRREQRVERALAAVGERELDDLVEPGARARPPPSRARPRRPAACPGTCRDRRRHGSWAQGVRGTGHSA